MPMGIGFSDEKSLDGSLISGEQCDYEPEERAIPVNGPETTGIASGNRVGRTERTDCETKISGVNAGKSKRTSTQRNLKD